jgi:hypothetical protein
VSTETRIQGGLQVIAIDPLTERLLRSRECGCYNCIQIFSPVEINDWGAETDGKTVLARCPYCQEFAVVGEADGVEVTLVSLGRMHIQFEELKKDISIGTILKPAKRQ